MDILIGEASRTIPTDCFWGLATISESKIEELLDQEHSFFNTSNPNRLREIAAGRVTARKLLEKAGGSKAPILSDPHGAPIWPRGFVGSISHKNDLCVVVIARQDRYRALGIDLEKTEPLSPDIWSAFTSLEEMVVATNNKDDLPVVANSVFSMKESIFKALYGVVGDAATPVSKISVNLKKEANLLNGRAFETGIEVWAKTLHLESYTLSIATA